MKITISPRAGIVTKGGDARPIDLSAMPQNIMSIDIDIVAGTAIEHGADGNSVVILDLTRYAAVLQAWDNWAPTPVPVVVQPPIPIRDMKKDEIRTAFEIASNANVVVGGVTYQGGYDKAMRLDAAKRLAELAGQSSTVFYDVANVGHSVTIQEASGIVLAVSYAFQTAFAHKQALMVAIDAAATDADVALIIW